MPPSFPLGGMENPLLTFASPSIITANGDKSGVSVVIHVKICLNYYLISKKINK